MTVPQQQVSARGVNFIRAWSRFSLDPYQDDIGRWKCGFGHVLRDDEPRETWTDVKARDMFAQDLDAAASDASYVTLNTMLMDHEFDALASLLFDMGPSAVRRSKLSALIATERFKEAATEFPRIALRIIVSEARCVTDVRWCYVCPLHRRFAEQAMFLYGDYSYVPPSPTQEYATSDRCERIDLDLGKL